jgi:5-formyltetrahydrofolate cyclo-ligase
MNNEDLQRNEIRNDIKQQRKSMRREEVEDKSRKIEERLFSLSHFLSASTISFYAAKKKQNEVETEQMIVHSLKKGKRVLVPITDTVRKTMLFSEVRDYSELSPRTFMIPEPAVENQRLVGAYNTDLIIVPGIAFNESGYRLGFGFGYYDKFLAGNVLKVSQVGLAYEFQIVDFPVKEYDIPVDLIITERRVVECIRSRNVP